MGGAEHVPSTLLASKQGHVELVVLLKKNKMLFSARSMKMEEHLSGMIGALGLEDLSFLLQEIADIKPRKIVKAIPSLLKELETTAMKHKVMIVGVWSVAVSGSGCWFRTLAASAEQLGWGVWCCPSVVHPLLQVTHSCRFFW